MRVLLATNDRSGKGGAGKAEALLRERGADVRACAVDELAAHDTTGLDRIVVAGGDGSVGPAAEVAARAGLPLAVVPTGTANDFARAARLPLDLAGACFLAADAGARTAPYELARMDGRPFLNAASAGLSVVAADEARPLKPSLGALAYAAGALRAGLRHSPEPACVEIDGEQLFDGAAWQVVVAATGHFGGGSATGGTDNDDLALDVVVVPGGSRIALLRRAAGMRLRRLHAQDDVPHHRGREVVVRGPRTFNVDGEVCSCGGRATFTVDDTPVRVVVGE